MQRAFLPVLGALSALFTILALLAYPIHSHRQDPIPLTPIARVEHPPIDEMSGIAKSRTYEGVFWVHNDSGDRPRIFAIRLDGSVVCPAPSQSDSDAHAQSTPLAYEGIQIEGATHIDWEDIAIDGDTLYIADMGNNFNTRRDLTLYVLKEPNPTTTTKTPILKRIPVAYPDQTEFPPKDRWHFDCEALFVYQGKLYVLTKHRPAGQPNTAEPSTTLYRLDSEHTDRVNLLVKVDSHPNLGGWVTAAAMSPDERTLAVLCQAPEQSVWLFERPEAGDQFLSKGKARQIKFQNGKQCEAIEWLDAHHVLIANEQREIFKLRVK